MYDDLMCCANCARWHNEDCPMRSYEWAIVDKTREDGMGFCDRFLDKTEEAKDEHRN